MKPTRVVRLGIDFGTTHTVAAVEDAEGGVAPLLFDASPLLLSAVYAEPGGGLLTGRDAERGALHDPSRFEPNPKLRVDDGRILLGDAEFDVEELIAAPLRRVAVEAGRHIGTAHTATLLTHPAAWAARRRDVLVRAAERAGLRSITLVPEPIAAAAYHSQALGRSDPPGSALAVYDLGGGTFDVSVVRRGSSGWEIVTSAGLDDVGGTDLDASIVDYIGTTVGAREPRRWRRLLSPTDHAGRRALRAFLDDVRGAKEQLSRTTSAVIQVPGFEVEAYLSREEFEAVAMPWLTRTVDLVARVVDQAGVPPSRLDGLFMVGGSSRIPLAATLLHRRFGIAPTLVEQPELVVALGSLRVPDTDADAPGAATEPDAWPTPLPEESAGSDSAPEPPSVGGPPRQAPPSTSARRSSRWRRLPGVAVGLAALLVVVMLAGWLANLVERNATGSEPGGSSASSGTADKGVQRVTIDKTAWYGGYRVTFGTATYDPAADHALTIALKVQNLGRKDQGLFQSALPIFVTLAGRTTGGDFTGPTITVGSGSTVEATVAFDLEQPAPNLAEGVLTLGADDALPAKVPIGPGGDLVTLQPAPVLTDTAITVKSMRFSHLACDLRGDRMVEYEQVRKGSIAIGCTFDVAYLGKEFNIGIGAENLRLVMPDGDLRAPSLPPNDLVERNEEIHGVRVVFVVPWPAAGRYALRLQDLDRYNSAVLATADVPLTMPAA